MSRLCQSASCTSFIDEDGKERKLQTPLDLRAYPQPDTQGGLLVAPSGQSPILSCPNAGEYQIFDTSQGGSFVNGRRFDEHEFTVGDRLEIGPFCFQFDGIALVSVTTSATTTKSGQAERERTTST